MKKLNWAAFFSPWYWLVYNHRRIWIWVILLHVWLIVFWTYRFNWNLDIIPSWYAFIYEAPNWVYHLEYWGTIVLNQLWGVGLFLLASIYIRVLGLFNFGIPEWNREWKSLLLLWILLTIAWFFAYFIAPIIYYFGSWERGTTWYLAQIEFAQNIRDNIEQKLEFEANDYTKFIEFRKEISGLMEVHPHNAHVTKQDWDNNYYYLLEYRLSDNEWIIWDIIIESENNSKNMRTMFINTLDWSYETLIGEEERTKQIVEFINKGQVVDYR